MPTARVCPNCQTSLPDEAQFCMHCGKATPTDPGVPARTMHTGEIEVTNVRRALADRYRVERVIGEGGMATVFLAEDLKHRRHVAVKVMRPELAATLGVDRFLREVEIAAQLTHPHILPVYDSGEVQGVLYYVMPYIEGESLAQRLARDGELPVDEAIRLTRETAEALGYAHKRGIVHRDIKPANILLNQGHALIADFGIARAVDAQGGALTRTGLAIGTPQYMSPEQATGDRNVDGRTDIYALGAVLYEMLTGEPPYTGRTSQAVIARMLTERPRPLGATREGLPAGLDAVVAQALARNPADRPATAETLAAALQSVTAPQVAGVVAAPETTQSSSDSNGKWLALGGLTMVALTLVSFVAGRWGLPPWVLWLALGLVAAGAVMLALTAREEGRRRAGVRATGLNALFTWRNSALGGLVAIFSWSAIAAVLSSRGAQSAPAGAVAGTRVAVLPFQNQGDSADNYFVDGITDEIRGKLSRVKGLAVIASGSSSQYRGSRLAPADIAKELNADYLLVGRVRWATGADRQRRVQVVSELVSRATGATSWQQSFDAGLTDVFAVQAEIATRVAGALGTQLGAEESSALAKAPTQVPAAWDEYLKGRATTGVDPAVQREAVAHFERAVALDPGLIAAWGALSAASARVFFNGNRDPAAAKRSREGFERALSLDSTSAVGYRAAATYYSIVLRDIAAADRAVATAVRIAPNDPDVLVGASAAALNGGRREEALKYLEHARELDPRSIAVLGQLQRTLLVAQRFQESVEAGEATLAFDDKSMVVYEFMAAAKIAQGDLAGATAVGQLALSRGNSPATVAANFAGFYEWSWMLEPSLQELVPRLTLAAFDDDRAWWAQSLAIAHWTAGRTDVARAFADSALVPSRVQVEAAPADPAPAMLYAVMLALAGKKGEALSEGKRALSLHAVKSGELGVDYDQLHMVRVCIAAGDVNCALEHTQDALKSGTYVTPAWVRLDPLFRSLRGNARFQQLVATGGK